MLNASAAQALFGTGDPIGACVRVKKVSAPCTRVVGIAEDTQRQNLTSGERPLQVYLPYPAAGPTLPAGR